MSLIRIQFSDDNIGTGAYTLSINPVSLDPQDSRDLSSIEMLDSENVSQESSFDSRQREMSWEGWDITHPVFLAQVQTLRGYIGSRKYINFNTISGFIIHDYNQWKGPFRILDISTKAKSGSGNFYESITLTYQPSL